MQRTTAQSQQESQKTRARLVLFWKPFYRMHAFNVARPRQRNIYQITSPTTCDLHAYRQAIELRLNSFFISTTLLSFGQLIHLDYFIWFHGEMKIIVSTCSWVTSENQAYEKKNAVYSIFKYLFSFLCWVFCRHIPCTMLCWKVPHILRT